MRRSLGFTLLELLVVLAILGLAYALVPPMITDGLSTAEMKSAARQLAAGLRKARNQAVTQRTEVLFTLDVDQRRFTVSGDRHTYRLPEELELRLVSAQQEVMSDSQAAIRFYPDGSSNGGRVTLSSEQRKFEVDVDWLTGRVAILD